MKTLTYAVVGTGALGGYFGGKLANSGKTVHFLARSDYEYIKQNGLFIQSPRGDFSIPEVNVYNNPADMPQCDVILVSLKTTTNFILGEVLPQISHKNSIIVMMQNGLGMEDDLSEIFPKLNIAGGLAYICSYKSGKGAIVHQDLGKITLGSYNMKDEQIIKTITEDFISANVPASFTNDLLTARWKKLVWNIPFNGLSVVLNADTQKIVLNSSSRQLVKAMMDEIIDAAQISGVSIEKEYSHEMLALTQKMIPYHPSMRYDFENKRPLEIEYIYNRPLQYAAKKGASMPLVNMLKQQLKFMAHEE